MLRGLRLGIEAVDLKPRCTRAVSVGSPTSPLSLTDRVAAQQSGTQEGFLGADR